MRKRRQLIATQVQQPQPPIDGYKTTFLFQ
jgi:hypothetical protein